jgi:hypothetical protein
MSEPVTDPEDDDEWRFGIDEVGPEAETETEDDEQIEPEVISPEHATFVAIGVLLTVAVIATGL